AIRSGSFNTALYIVIRKKSKNGNNVFKNQETVDHLENFQLNDPPNLECRICDGLGSIPLNELLAQEKA
ncbi:MAG: hypothetical protein K6E84_08760, partial [Lachnospiraceae bacterium]|nr:hypothetical protein [Lachnospiraceae bacterium]